MTLNERISEWFEPRPNFTRTRELLEKRWYDSPKRCWTLHRYSGQPIESIGSWYWLPIGWDTDEAANARLLEAMKPKEPSVTWNLDTELWEIELLDGGYREVCETIAAHADRKTAIVLAFCKFANIQVGKRAR